MLQITCRSVERYSTLWSWYVGKLTFDFMWTKTAEKYSTSMDPGYLIQEPTNGLLDTVTYTTKLKKHTFRAVEHLKLDGSVDISEAAGYILPGNRTHERIYLTDSPEGEIEQDASSGTYPFDHYYVKWGSRNRATYAAWGRRWTTKSGSTGTRVAVHLCYTDPLKGFKIVENHSRTATDGSSFNVLMQECLLHDFKDDGTTPPSTWNQGAKWNNQGKFDELAYRRTIDYLCSYCAAPSDSDSYNPTTGENPVAWSDLSRRALESMPAYGFDGNGYAFLRDCADMKNSVKSMLNTFKSMARKLNYGRGGKALALSKAFAAMYLSIHYGWSLWLNDAKDVMDAYNSYNGYEDLQHLHASGDYIYDGWNRTRGYTIVYDPNTNWDYVEELLNRFDLKLRLENVWDLIPYSFAIDWFADISGTLSSLDNLSRLKRDYKLAASIKTVKSTKLFTSGDLPLGTIGNMQCSFFKRTVDTKIVTPNALVTVHSFDSSKHTVEAGALITVNL